MANATSISALNLYFVHRQAHGKRGLMLHTGGTFGTSDARFDMIFETNGDVLLQLDRTASKQDIFQEVGSLYRHQFLELQTRNNIELEREQGGWARRIIESLRANPEFPGVIHPQETSLA
jgi:hypothetical protein